MEACNPATKGGNVGLAFGIVTAAGLSTSIGAALAFVLPKGDKTDNNNINGVTGNRATNLFLAASLGLAAGVMVFVSFVEIYADKAVSSFADCLPNNDRRDALAYLYATLCFFAGVLITYLFEIVLHAFEKWVISRGEPSDNSNTAAGVLDHDDNDTNLVVEAGQKTILGDSIPKDVENVILDDDSDEKLDPTTTTTNTADGIIGCATTSGRARSASIPRSEQNVDIMHEVGHEGEMVATIYERQSDARILTRLGIFAGIALAFHNFPEGLATFVAVMDDPKVGASVAIAIAIHNIPEGICVSIPIYYATGSKWKAFFWATLSGISELFGAALGLIIVRSIGGFSQNVYGVLFGIVAGMMVYISLKQLLPTAHKYDTNDRVSSASLCAGMLIMAVSLVLFKF